MIRVKGFLKKVDDRKRINNPEKPDVLKKADGKKEGEGEQIWYEINASRDSIDFHETKIGQEVVILVGEHLNSEAIGALFGETRSVTDYSI